MKFVIYPTRPELFKDENCNCKVDKIVSWRLRQIYFTEIQMFVVTSFSHVTHD